MRRDSSGGAPPQTAAETEKPLNVALVSNVSHYATGGTAAYINFLGKNLQRRGNRVQGIARFHLSSPPNTRYEATDDSANQSLRGDAPDDLVSDESAGSEGSFDADYT